jgi:ABC-type transporter Mla subunit MlaD
VGRFAAAVALSAVLAAVAGGCGGSSPEEKWAGSVCSDVGDWKSQVQKASDDVKTQLQSPQAGTLAAINTDVRSAVEATQQLATDLKATKPPDTEAGTQAKQQIDSLASQLDTTVTKAKQTVDSVPQGAGLVETAKKLAPLASDLSSLLASASSTLSSVQAGASEIKSGFDNADSCKQFQR